MLVVFELHVIVKAITLETPRLKNYFSNIVIVIT
jgi:hypothetical protein